MNSLYSKYIFEIEQILTVETDKYFFNYKLVEDELHIYEVYILPEFRSSEVTKELLSTVETLAKSLRAVFIVGFIHEAHFGWQRSLKFQQNFGMEVIKDEDGKKTLCKKVIYE